MPKIVRIYPLIREIFKGKNNALAAVKLDMEKILRALFKGCLTAKICMLP